MPSDVENQESDDELFFPLQPLTSSRKRPYPALEGNENDEPGNVEPAESVTIFHLTIRTTDSG